MNQIARRGVSSCCRALPGAGKDDAVPRGLSSRLTGNISMSVSVHDAGRRGAGEGGRSRLPFCLEAGV